MRTVVNTDNLCVATEIEINSKCSWSNVLQDFQPLPIRLYYLRGIYYSGSKMIDGLNGELIPCLLILIASDR